MLEGVGILIDVDVLFQDGVDGAADGVDVAVGEEGGAAGEDDWNRSEGSECCVDGKWLSTYVRLCRHRRTCA